jgi:SAM-dependent methyltransferase
LNPEYGQRYRELFEKHWWWRARTEFILKTLRRLKPPNGWKEILDVGCGDGLFFPRLREFGEVEGIEPSTALVNPSNPDSRFIYLCTFDSNFRPGKRYSLILMLDVLEHLENPLEALRHARNLLQADGMLVMTVPAFKAIWTNHDVINHHFTRYTKSRLRRLSSEAGLRIFEDRYLYHWTYPVKLVLRFVERTFRLKPKPARVPAEWINQPLYWVSRLEQETLTRLPIPAGSSLIAIAKQAPSNSPRQ